MPFGAIGDAVKSAGKGLSSIFGSAKGIPGLGDYGDILTKLAAGAAGIGGIGGGVAEIASPFQKEKSAKQQGKDLGEAQRAFLEKAYPGTNPWEQLGTGQAGGAGSAALSGQRTQEKINRRSLDTQLEINARTLEMNKRIADKQALAAVAPSVLEHHPELADKILQNVTENKSGVGPTLNTSLKERRFTFEQRIRTLEADIKRAGVDVARFNSLTRRLALDLDNRKFDFDQSVKIFESELKNKEMAVRYVTMMKEVYDAVGGTAWKATRSALDELVGAATDTPLTVLRNSVERIDVSPPQVPGRVPRRTGVR